MTSEIPSEWRILGIRHRETRARVTRVVRTYARQLPDKTICQIQFRRTGEALPNSFDAPTKEIGKCVCVYEVSVSHVQIRQSLKILPLFFILLWLYNFVL